MNQKGYELWVCESSYKRIAVISQRGSEFLTLGVNKKHINNVHIVLFICYSRKKYLDTVVPSEIIVQQALFGVGLLTRMSSLAVAIPWDD